MSRGWRSVAEKVLPEAVRGKAGPAFGRGMDRLRVPPTGLKTGVGVDASDRDRRPVVLVLLLDAETSRVRWTVGALAEAAAAAGTARPLLVLDTPDFAVARRAGIPVEHVLDERTWSQRYPERPYSEYLARRLDLLRRDYATDRFLRLPAAQDEAADRRQLASSLRAAPEPRWRRWWLPAAIRAEALIDRPSAGA